MKKSRPPGGKRPLLRAASAAGPPPVHGILSREILAWQPASGIQTKKDSLAEEEPLEIRVRGKPLVVTMRTRGHDAELAAGFLCTESFVTNKNDILAIDHCAIGPQAIDQNIVNVFLRPQIGIDPRRAARHGFISSSCGICGKATIESVHQHHPPIADDFTLPLAEIARLPERLKAAQAAFAQTGGLHAAAVFDERLQLVCLREDIGRHNAVDKVIGYGFLSGTWPFARHLLLVSGRASFEILQKALVARIPVIAAISAPSSLAVDFARESNQTLIGFLRGGSMNIYSSPERLR